MRWPAALLVAAVLFGLVGEAGAARAAGSEVTETLALIPSGALYPEAAENKPLRPQSIRAVVTSLRAARSLVLPGGETWDRRRTGQSPDIFFGAALFALRNPEPWRAAVGVELEQVTAIAAYGSGRSNTGAVWVLTDESVAALLLAHLKTRGFAPVEGGWLVNGDLDKIDRPHRAPADPFRGGLGESYAVRQVGRLLYQQKTLTLPPPPRLFQSLFSAARDALGDASQDVALVQAMVVSLLIEAPDVSRAEDMQPVGTSEPRDQAEVKKIWEAEIQRSAAAVRTAIPFTPVAILADFEDAAAGRRGLIVILPYDNCDAARTANARFPALWQAAPHSILFNVTRPDAVVTTAVLDQGPACTAIIRVTTQASAGTVVNPAWQYVGRVFYENLPGPFAMAPP